MNPAAADALACWEDVHRASCKRLDGHTSECARTRMYPRASSCSHERAQRVLTQMKRREAARPATRTVRTITRAAPMQRSSWRQQAMGCDACPQLSAEASAAAPALRGGGRRSRSERSGKRPACLMARRCATARRMRAAWAAGVQRRAGGACCGPRTAAFCGARSTRRGPTRAGELAHRHRQPPPPSASTPAGLRAAPRAGRAAAGAGRAVCGWPRGAGAEHARRMEEPPARARRLRLREAPPQEPRLLRALFAAAAGVCVVYAVHALSSAIDPPPPRPSPRRRRRRQARGPRSQLRVWALITSRDRRVAAGARRTRRTAAFCGEGRSCGTRAVPPLCLPPAGRAPDGVPPCARRAWRSGRRLRSGPAAARARRSRGKRRQSRLSSLRRPQSAQMTPCTRARCRLRPMPPRTRRRTAPLTRRQA